MLNWVLAAILTICGMTMVSCFSDTKKSAAVSATDDASQFVTITDVVPDVILEIRYFSTYNFVGTRIDGYEEPTALLTKQAADSLKAVSDDVKAQGYRLKIYDAYRPQKGVDHFVRWAEDINDTLMKAYFYPDLEKSVLFPQDYICLKSGHTRGSTLDLTLFDIGHGRHLRLVRSREPSRLLRQSRDGRIHGRQFEEPCQSETQHYRAAVQEPHDSASSHAASRL